MTEEPTPLEPTPQEVITGSQAPIVDLGDKDQREVAEADGDMMLERTLKHLKDQVKNPREAVAGFSSAA
jgi:hypothetical protein